MDRTLLLNAVNKVKGLTESETTSLSAEEAGVLELYLSTREAALESLSPEEQMLCERIRDVLAQWSRPGAETGETKPGAPDNQRMLRAALDKLQRGEDTRVSQAEVELIRATQAALARRTNGSPNKLKQLIDRLLAEYDARSAAPEPEVAGAAASGEPAETRAEPGKPAANHLNAETFFAERPRRRVESLDGIETDLHAAVYEVEGETVLDGDVPDDAVVVVRNGGITINGFMGGSVVAAQDITINGNVSGGWVVSTEGNVGAQRALANSSLVAKKGSVRAEHMETPSCVFAFGDLRVRGDVHGGKLLGRNIQVDGTVSGAELHGVGRIEAGRFQTSARAYTIICLRETLCCEDYGQTLDPAQRKLHRSIGKHQYDSRVLAQLIRYAKRDIYDAQRSILFYLLGGVATTQGVRALRGLQSQATYFTGLFETADRLARLLRSQTEARRGIPAEDIKVVAHECIDALRHIEDEVETTANAFHLEHKGAIVRAARDLCQQAVALAKGELDDAAMKQLWPELEAKREHWKELAGELAQGVETQVREFGLEPAVVRSITSETGKLEGMLEHVFAEIAKKPDTERYNRARSTVVRLIQTTISRNAGNVENWERRLCETERTLDSVRDSLDASGMYLLADGPDGAVQVRARAYDAGTVVVANPASRADPLNTAEDKLELDAARADPTVFTLYRGMLHEHAWEDAPRFEEL